MPTKCRPGANPLAHPVEEFGLRQKVNMEIPSECSWDDVAFKKQFLVSPANFAHPAIEGWLLTNVTRAHVLWSHPALSISSAQRDGLALHGLGVFLDPRNPFRDEHAILRDLLRGANTFAQLESLIAELAGRWVLIAVKNDQARIYHDAAGLKPIFFTHRNSSDLYVASQPSLLCAVGVVGRNEDVAREFELHDNSGSWPIGKVPYHSTTQVLPNHYLDLVNVSVQRYWPAKEFEKKTLGEAAEEMLPMLRGIISAAHSRNKLAMNLTGGYDSRLVLAAAQPLWGEIQFSTTIRADSPHHDISIPRKLKAQFSLNHRFITPAKIDLGSTITNEELVRRLMPNVGGMFYDPAIQGTKAAWLAVGKKLALPGLVSEVMRCFYYSGGVHPESLTGEDLAKRAGFKGNPIAEDGFNEWLASVPADLPIHALDLLYWEHRLGVWASCSLTFREALMEQIPPMNCRKFLEIGLATDVDDRKAPYALMRELIKQAEPKLLSIDFNQDWVDRWGWEIRRLPLPWKLKRRLRWV